jgi:hypothetical protein
VFDNTYAYCGRYEIDEKQNVLVHLPEVATGPSYVGSRQLRPYRFDGNRLILSGGPNRESPDIVSWQIIWEKVHRTYFYEGARKGAAVRVAP